MELVLQSLRDEYAHTFQALDAWTPRTPDQVKRRATLLNLGRMIGTAVHAGSALPASLAAQLVGLLPNGVATATAQTAMRAWIQAANGLMQGSAQLSGLELTNSTLPVLLVAGGAWLIWRRNKKRKRKKRRRA